MSAIDTSTLSLADLLGAFLHAKSAEGRSHNTLRVYRFDNSRLLSYLEEQGVTRLGELSPDHLRGFLTLLGDGHNTGGVHGYYRSMRAFLHWVWDEHRLETRNPVSRLHVRSPQVHAKPGVTPDEIRRLVNACTTDLASRDRSIFMTLLATGARAEEFVRLNVGHVDFTTPLANVYIWHGKGDQSRTVHLGARAKREVMHYLRERKDAGEAITKSSPLFVTDAGERFTVSGLRQIVRRRAAAANMEMPGLHDFRRGCGRLLLRNGMNLEYIRQYLGHKSLDVTRRYLGTEDPDVEQSFRSASPVDNIRW